MAKQSVTPRVDRPTIGTQRKSKQFKSARVVKTLPRTGVLPEFIGESPSKEWLARGTKLVMRGRFDCHDRPYCGSR